MSWVLNAGLRLAGISAFLMPSINAKQNSQSKTAYTHRTKMFEFHSPPIKCLPWTFYQGYFVLSTTKATVETGSF